MSRQLVLALIGVLMFGAATVWALRSRRSNDDPRNNPPPKLQDANGHASTVMKPGPTPQSQESGNASAAASATSTQTVSSGPVRQIATPKSPKAPEPVQLQRPSFVTRYDVSTMDDLRYAYLLSSLIDGDELTQWSLLNEGLGQLKQYIGDALDATVIAETITTSMPIDGQKAFKRIDDVVNECAQVLGVEKPAVFIRSSPIPQAYVRAVQKPHVLVLTSRLIELYDDAPSEFRFVIGHELGHIKCRHLQMQTASVGILAVLSRVNASVFQDNVILPTLAFGRFLSWCRESEVSADRCGLLCCQDPQVAYNAMFRLLHGLRPDLKTLGPDDIDASQVIAGLKRWENRPFVEFLTDLKRQTITHPFIPERVAQLKMWNDSGVPDEILARKEPPTGEFKVQIKLVVIKDLTSEGSTVDPYLCFRDENGGKLFESAVQEQVRSAAWSDFGVPVHITDGQPIFVEIWDSNYLPDSEIGLFVVYPTLGKTHYTRQILWDVRERKAPTIRAGIAKVKLEFVEEEKVNVSSKAPVTKGAVK